MSYEKSIPTRTPGGTETLGSDSEEPGRDAWPDFRVPILGEEIGRHAARVSDWSGATERIGLPYRTWPIVPWPSAHGSCTASPPARVASGIMIGSAE